MSYKAEKTAELHMPSHRASVFSEQPDVASRLRTAFPRLITVELDRVLQIMPAAELKPTPDEIGPVRLQGEDVHIPHRIYSVEPDELSLEELSGIQPAILACLFSRHHDGLVREKYLRQLLPVQESWVPPFVIQLVGEYVLEIILTVACDIRYLRDGCYAAFAAENPAFLGLLRQRIISYWDCYYRRQFPRFQHNPAFQVFKALGWWNKHDARRLSNR